MDELLKVKVHKYQPIYYAGASLDFNTIHIDDEFGKSVGLGGKILQGLCTMAYAYRGIMKNTDPSKIKTLKVRFSGIVRPEDELTVKGKLKESNNNISHYDLVVENHNHDLVITSASAIIEN